MKVSARNQLKGTVSSVKEGAVNGVVVLAIGEQIVKCDITMEAIRELELAEGKEAIAIIKASNVIIAAGSDPIGNISARNQFAGTVTKVEKGAVNGHVTIEIADGIAITSSITNESIDDLELAVDGAAVAVVKATDVLVAVN